VPMPVSAADPRLPIAPNSGVVRNSCDQGSNPGADGGRVRVLSKVLYDDKAQEVQNLQLECNFGSTVGDGVNDPPALA
jgi:hypothetical protein